MSPQLSISDRAHRWMFRAQIASFKKRLDLFQEARSHHRAEALSDSGVQFAAFKGRGHKFCDVDVVKNRHTLLLQSRDAFARQPVHLECALNALRIVDM